MTDDDKKEGANPPQSPQGDASAVTPAIVESLKVHSLAEYLHALDSKIHSALGRKDGIWYRGNSDANHRLVPSIFRLLGDNPSLASQEDKDICRDQEIQANLHYVMHANAIDKDFPENDQVSQLVVMRHHGLLSRLLDWTDSPLAALLFAVVESAIKSEKDSCVWVISPYILTQKFFPHLKVEGVLMPKGPFLQKMAEIAFDTHQMKEESVIPFIPQYSSMRQKAQKSMFTMHCSLLPLDEFPDKHRFLRKIIIPKRYHQTIYTELSYAGITWDSLFPDLDGLAQFMNIAAKINFNSMKMLKKPPPIFKGDGG